MTEGAKRSNRLLSRVALACVMVVAGLLHFIATDAYVSIMPDYLPWHRELVYISGVLQIAGGLGLLVPKTRAFSGWGLIALYIAVLPANLNMALYNIQPESFTVPLALLWARLPLQLVFIYWAWHASRPGVKRALKSRAEPCSEISTEPLGADKLSHWRE